MRLLAVTACVVALTTAPALACPRHMLCVVQPDAAPGAEVARTPRQIRLPDARAVQRVAPVAMDFGAAPARRVVLAGPRTNADSLRPLPIDEVEMPWIWEVVRANYDAHVPKYEEPERFKLSLSPVVVASPSWDPIPGVGIAGAY